MNKFGTYTGHGYALTYQIGEAEPAASLTGSGRGTESDGQVALSARRMGAYYYWPAGANNDDPDVCAALIKGNRLLPSLIEKQVAILYGTGPMLFTEETGDDGTVSRRYIQDPEVQAWLEGWKRNGLPDSYKEYLIKCIRSYYYSEGIFSQWQLTRGTMAHVPGTLPVAGLRHISELRPDLPRPRTSPARRTSCNRISIACSSAIGGRRHPRIATVYIRSSTLSSLCNATVQSHTAAMQTMTMTSMPPMCSSTVCVNGL